MASHTVDTGLSLSEQTCLLPAWKTYAACRQEIHTFRLCHSSGHGENAHVGRLPQELAATIESLVFTDRGESALNDWIRASRCLEGRCDPLGHNDRLDPRKFYGEELYGEALNMAEICWDCYKTLGCLERVKKYIYRRRDGFVGTFSYEDAHDGLLRRFERFFPQHFAIAKYDDGMKYRNVRTMTQVSFALRLTKPPDSAA